MSSQLCWSQILWLRQAQHAGPACRMTKDPTISNTGKRNWELTAMMLRYSHGCRAPFCTTWAAAAAAAVCRGSPVSSAISVGGWKMEEAASIKDKSDRKGHWRRSSASWTSTAIVPSVSNPTDACTRQLPSQGTSRAKNPELRGWLS